MTTSEGLETVIGPALAGALERKGYASLTPVQQAVLDPALAERDLRITSQTGSGKTVAIGLAVRDLVVRDASPLGGLGAPHVLVVTPTRELAKQVEEELAWLFAPLKVKVASVTGGASYRDERRALGAGPAVLVGTPGRLLDHLTKGGINSTRLAAVILDEADRMLDLGFKDDLEAILAYAPDEHRTHLMSATFPREVRALADAVQTDPAMVEGTPIGVANTDIEHVIHLVDPKQRLDAIVNLLLATPDAPSLVFARTRADVAEITRLLALAGFTVSSLSGEMDQPERNRALAAFKRGDLHALVATDVAARGIDVQDIGRVIHAEPPNDPDTYTHRSGRTGRAGRKGTSSVLAPPMALNRTISLLKRARVRYRIEGVPTAADIRATAEARLFDELTKAEGGTEPDERAWALAKRLAEAGETTRTLARLLSMAKLRGPTEPREVRQITPPQDRGGHVRDARDERPDEGPRPLRSDRGGNWVRFRISWGSAHGADARRVLAMVCRRGSVRGHEVGAIKVERAYSTVEIAGPVADAFAKIATEPDPRDPRVNVWRDTGGPGPGPNVVPAARTSRPRVDADVPPARVSRPRIYEEVPAERTSKPRLHDAPPPARISKPRLHDAPPPARISKPRIQEAPPARASRPRLHDAPPPHAVKPRAHEGAPPRPRPHVHDAPAPRPGTGKFARGTGARSHAPMDRPPPRGPKKPHRKGQDRTGPGDVPPKRRPG